MTCVGDFFICHFQNYLSIYYSEEINQVPSLSNRGLAMTLLAIRGVAIRPLHKSKRVALDVDNVVVVVFVSLMFLLLVPVTAIVQFLRREQDDSNF